MYSNQDGSYTCVICGNEVAAPVNLVNCFKCNGSGKVEEVHLKYPNKVVRCDDCEGSGKRPPANGGMKLIQINETFAPCDPVIEEFRELDAKS
jgi:DnaJ-class molecular chaperone